MPRLTYLSRCGSILVSVIDRFEISNSESIVPRATVASKDRSRRWPNLICPALPIHCRKTSRNTCDSCSSNLFDGDRHQATEMPMLLAGKGGGSLRPGRVLDYRDRGDPNRRACSLYLSLLDRMGVALPRFGDTDRRLAEL